MCWQVALPLITSAAGAAVQNQSAQDTQRRQDQAAAEGVMRQAALNRTADTKVAQSVQQLAASNDTQDVAKRRAAYTDALRKAAPVRAGTMPVNGNVSSRFADDAATATADTEANAQAQADLTARIEAPTYQRAREGVALDNTNTELSLLKGQSSGQDYLTRLRLAMTKPNPWLNAGGQVLSGLGNGMATNGGWDSGGLFGDGTIAPVKTTQKKV